jgi:hypothetical protein
LIISFTIDGTERQGAETALNILPSYYKKVLINAKSECVIYGRF